MLEWTGLTPRENFSHSGQKEKQREGPPNPTPQATQGDNNKENNKTKGGEGPVHSLTQSDIRERSNPFF